MTFFKTSSWFNAYFKVLMWITYSILSDKLVTSLSTFSISIFQVNMVNDCKGHVIFQDIEPKFWGNTLHHSLNYNYKLPSNSVISSIHLKSFIFVGNFSDISKP